MQNFVTADLRFRLKKKKRFIFVESMHVSVILISRISVEFYHN